RVRALRVEARLVERIERRVGVGRANEHVDVVRPPRSAGLGRGDPAHQRVLDVLAVERRDDLAEDLLEHAVLRAAQVLLDLRIPYGEPLERDADGVLRFHGVVPRNRPCKRRAAIRAVAEVWRRYNVLRKQICRSTSSKPSARCASRLTALSSVVSLAISSSPRARAHSSAACTSLVPTPSRRTS